MLGVRRDECDCEAKPRQRKGGDERETTQGGGRDWAEQKQREAERKQAKNRALKETRKRKPEPARNAFFRSARGNSRHTLTNENKERMAKQGPRGGLLRTCVIMKEVRCAYIRHRTTPAR